MAKDSAAVTISVGDAITFVGVVAAITEPDSNNVANIWVKPTNTAVKDNAANTLFSNFSCIKFNGSQLTK
jgi:hypothetical protein